jgi:hypothetical protein
MHLSNPALCNLSLPLSTYRKDHLPGLKKIQYMTNYFFPQEICGAGEAGWRIHDLETSGVSI